MPIRSWPCTSLGERNGGDDARFLKQEDHIGHYAGMAVDTACGRMTRVMVCVEVSPSTYAVSRCTLGTASNPPRIASAMRNRPRIQGRLSRRFRRTILRRVWAGRSTERQLYQQWRIAAEFDVDSHDLPGDRDRAISTPAQTRPTAMASNMPNTDMNKVINVPLTKKARNAARTTNRMSLGALLPLLLVSSSAHKRS